MSIRTVIEINHDYLHDWEENPSYLENLLWKLKSGDWDGKWLDRDTPGIRRLGQRHHSETIKLTIG